VKALACELPSRLGVPLSRLHVPDIAAEVVARGLVAEISGTTIWRWLSEDAIRLWKCRSWIFPRDPTARLRESLRAERGTFRVELHPIRPGPPHEEAGREGRLPDGRMSPNEYVIEITVQSTK
jgi:hypothetical protein